MIMRLFALMILATMALCPVKTMANGLVGDVNGNRTVDVEDVTNLIEYVLNPESVSAGTIEVDGVSGVDIGDVIALIELVLNPSPKMTFVVNGQFFSLLPVEGGTYKMGSRDADAMEIEGPVHSVTLSSFFMGETEVTQALWKAVMNNNPSTYKGDRLPVHKVTWDNCQKFISKLNELTGFEFRMPTEAEWEFAARGGNLSHGYKYAGSNNIDEVAWYTANANSKPNEVAAKLPNELGLFDMSGNVKEWCSDYFAGYPSLPQTDPTGPAEEDVTFKSRVNRGGAYIYADTGCRVTARSDLQQTNSAASIGLRLVLPASQVNRAE